MADGTDDAETVVSERDDMIFALRERLYGGATTVTQKGSSSSETEFSETPTILNADPDTEQSRCVILLSKPCVDFF